MQAVRAEILFWSYTGWVQDSGLAVFSFGTLTVLLFCLLASFLMGNAFVLFVWRDICCCVSVPLYVTCLLSLAAFQIFLLVTGFEQIGYDVSACSFLHFSCAWVHGASWMCGFIVISTLELFLQYFFFPPPPTAFLFRTLHNTYIRLLEAVP